MSRLAGNGMVLAQEYTTQAQQRILSAAWRGIEPVTKAVAPVRPTKKQISLDEATRHRAVSLYNQVLPKRCLIVSYIHRNRRARS